MFIAICLLAWWRFPLCLYVISYINNITYLIVLGKKYIFYAIWLTLIMFICYSEPALMKGGGGDFPQTRGFQWGPVFYLILEIFRYRNKLNGSNFVLFLSWDKGVVFFRICTYMPPDPVILSTVLFPNITFCRSFFLTMYISP